MHVTHRLKVTIDFQAGWFSFILSVATVPRRHYGKYEFRSYSRIAEFLFLKLDSGSS